MKWKELEKIHKKRIDRVINQLNEDLCRHCRCTDYGDYKVNTGPWNICEGAYCNETGLDYLVEKEEEKVYYYKNRRF